MYGIPEFVGASIATIGAVGIVFVSTVFLINLPKKIPGLLGMKIADMLNKKILQ